MYMKKYVMLIFFSLSVHLVSAQVFMLGLRAGVSSSAVQIEETLDYAGGAVTMESGNKTLGWHAGLFSRITIAKLYIQPELLFVQSGGEIEVTPDGATEPELGEITFNKIDVPIMVGYKFGGVFRLNVGPSLSFILSDQTSGSNYVKDLEQTYNSATIGYQAGLGIDIWKLLVDLKYEGSLSSLGDEVTIPGVNETFSTDLRNSQIILSVGLKF
jgi:hypothetical protein